MISKVILLFFLTEIHANFNNGGFGFSGMPGMMTPLQGFDNSRFSQMDNKFTNSQGTGAAAGQATADEGQVSSINTAEHQASRGQTHSNALSANTASGLNPAASGAVEVGGGVNHGHQHQSVFENQSGFSVFRKKRQLFNNDFSNNLPGAFNFQPVSHSNANSLGGGRADMGNINVNNMAYTNSNPWGSSGFAHGNAAGSGQGLSLWNAATSDSFSGGRKRRSLYNNGMDYPSVNGGMDFPQMNYGVPSMSSSNSLGGANTGYGTAFTNNQAISRSDQFGGSAMGNGNAGGSGYNVNAWNAAIANSQSG